MDLLINHVGRDTIARSWPTTTVGIALALMVSWELGVAAMALLSLLAYFVGNFSSW